MQPTDIRNPQYFHKVRGTRKIIINNNIRSNFTIVDWF